MELKKIGTISVAHFDIHNVSSDGEMALLLQKDYVLYFCPRFKQWYYAVDSNIHMVNMLDVLIWSLVKELKEIKYEKNVTTWQLSISSDSMKEIIEDLLDYYLYK